MIGERIGHYQILEKLGSGGMGEVWLAEDTTLDRKVALKFLPYHAAQDENEKARFIQEAKAAARLKHQNIAQVYEIGEEDGRLYIVMEYVEAGSLRDKLDEAKGRSLPPDDVLSWVQQTAEGLAEAHKQGIIHRDIKPDNLMLTESGQIKITDFGLARLETATRLTASGITLGTVGYISPEQIRGEQVDHRSDLFSLGVTLYELLTGTHPFLGPDAHSTYYAVLSLEPEPPSSIRTDVTDKLDEVVAHLLEKDPKSRYQSADEVVNELKRIQESLKPPSHREVSEEGPEQEGQVTQQPSIPLNRRIRFFHLTVNFLIIIVAVLFLGSRLQGVLEKGLYDRRLSNRIPLPVPEEIILIDIDQESTALLERHSWNRTWHAKLIQNLARAGARVVAFDMLFAEDNPAGDSEFLRAIEEIGIAVLGGTFTSATGSNREITGLEAPVGILSRAPYGILNISFDWEDSVCREYPILYYYQGKQVLQLGIQALKKYLEIPDSEPVIQSSFGYRLGDYFIPRGPGGGMLINFIGTGASIPTYSYISIVDDVDTDIGEGDRNAFDELLERGQLEGKIAFVSSTIPVGQDSEGRFIFPNTASGASRAEVHAHAVNTILRQQFIRTIPWLDTLLLIVMLIISRVISQRMNSRSALIVCLILLGLILGGDWLLFTKFNTWIWVYTPTLGIALAFTATAFERALIRRWE